MCVQAAKLKAQQFGVAIESDTITFELLGIGPQIFADRPKYSFFIDSLASQGYTKSRASSLDLRSMDSPDG